MPRLFALLPLLLLVASLQAQAPHSLYRTIDVLDYDFTITLSPTSDEIQGVAEMEFKMDANVPPSLDRSALNACWTVPPALVALTS